MSRPQAHTHDGMAARVQHMQRNMCTASQNATELVLYELCQQLAESERGESEYEKLFAVGSEVYVKSGKYQEVKHKPSDIIEPSRFPHPSNDPSLPSEDDYHGS